MKGKESNFELLEPLPSLKGPYCQPVLQMGEGEVPVGEAAWTEAP